MGRKQLFLTAFIVVVLIQLAVPAKMIWDRERVLATGKDFKFETAPIDPSDPFRGKYITLQYKENSFPIDPMNPWIDAERIFVILKTDADGFAKIESISKEKPSADVDFVQAEVEYISGLHSKTVTISYPFDKFYMEETKAYEAERAYNETQMDSTQRTYALVSIKKGDAVLKDVFIDGVSIQKVVESRTSIEK